MKPSNLSRLKISVVAGSGSQTCEGRIRNGAAVPFWLSHQEPTSPQSLPPARSRSARRLLSCSPNLQVTGTAKRAGKYHPQQLNSSFQRSHYHLHANECLQGNSLQPNKVTEIHSTFWARQQMSLMRKHLNLKL